MTEFDAGSQEAAAGRRGPTGPTAVGSPAGKGRWLRVAVWPAIPLLFLALTGYARAGLESAIRSTGPAERTLDESQPVEPAPPRPGGAEVGLDRLLQLPSSMSFETERRGGATAEEWRARFEETRSELGTAQQDLQKAKDELDQLAGGGAGGQWQVAPPGSNQTQISPMSFKLREEMRRGRERLDESEKTLRALEIEADLAGVPHAWRVRAE